MCNFEYGFIDPLIRIDATENWRRAGFRFITFGLDDRVSVAGRRIRLKNTQLFGRGVSCVLDKRTERRRRERDTLLCELLLCGAARQDRNPKI